MQPEPPSNTKGMGFDDFLKDRKTRNAIERNLEILGESARRVSQEAREGLPDIPWRSMIGLRNVLAHEYGEVRYEVLWNIVRNQLAPLIKQLEEMGIDNPPEVV
jgi:uncharacterized protein with HEPN domain